LLRCEAVGSRYRFSTAKSGLKVSFLHPVSQQIFKFQGKLLLPLPAYSQFIDGVRGWGKANDKLPKRKKLYGEVTNLKEKHWSYIRSNTITKQTNQHHLTIKMKIYTCNNTAKEILKCWEVLLALRPHLIKEEFVSTIQQMFTEGYRLAFIKADGIIVAAVGYRYLQYLYNGKHIYIDDLSTLAGYRGNGYAAALLNYVETEAIQKGFKTITLDSGYQRNDAHRLYLKTGYRLVAHHFSKTLK